MIKLILPEKPFKGLKIYCKICRTDNPKCSHFDNQFYKVRIHVPQTEKSIKSKILTAKNYKAAVKEAIEFEDELEQYNFEIPSFNDDEGNDYSVVDAIIKYNQYLNGDTGYAQFKKNISVEHKDESIRFCRIFANSLKLKKDISKMRINEVNKKHVSTFYIWAENHYSGKTFNKCFNALRLFFKFLIEIEEILMKNPFLNCTKIEVVHSNIETITSKEFRDILDAVDNYDPIQTLSNGVKKNMYQPYLKHAFRLFLLTGARREEVVDLRWSNILITSDDVMFFKIKNLKVNKIKKSADVYKYIPINADLIDLLVEMNYNERKHSTDYILFPERELKSKTIMDKVSKSFTHYKKGAGIEEKNISLKTLRKTYITWVNKVMEKDTAVLTSHSTQKTLDNHYLDPKIISIIEKAALQIKIF